MVGPVSVGWISWEASGIMAGNFAFEGLNYKSKPDDRFRFGAITRPLVKVVPTHRPLALLVAKTPSNQGRFCVFCIQSTIPSTTFSSIP